VSAATAGPDSTAPAGALPTTVIVPPTAWAPLDLAELWRARELLGFLLLRDLKVRYKQTVLGATWVVIRPLMTSGVFALIFGGLAGLSAGETPYALFVFAGMAPWQYFATALQGCGGSLVDNAHILTKVYFPRLAVPLSAILTALVDFALTLAVLAVALLAYRQPLGPGVLLLPVFAMLAVGAALGLGLWFAAVNGRYRDAGRALTFAIQLAMWLTPVAYPAAVVRDKLGASALTAPAADALFHLYMLNPMAVVVSGFRTALLGSEPAWAAAWVPWASGALVALWIATGLVYFRRVESTFADVV
jgi:lipopolysaccharide transport system permease protein